MQGAERGGRIASAMRNLFKTFRAKSMQKAFTAKWSDDKHKQ